MVAIEELSNTPGNCFSCGNLKKFVPCGKWVCLVVGEKLTDTNQPLETDCKHWVEKKKQVCLTHDGQFAGIENYL